jgi:hypothetical protein
LVAEKVLRKSQRLKPYTFAIRTSQRYAKNCKRVCLFQRYQVCGKNYERPTMYIKNRRNSSKIKAFGSCQNLCLIENLVLRNRLLLAAAKRYASLYNNSPDNKINMTIECKTLE